MRTKVIEQFIRSHISPALPQYRVHKGTLSVVDGYYVKGYLLSGSSQWDKYQMSVHAFVLPLFRNIDYIPLTYAIPLTWEEKKGRFKTIGGEHWRAVPGQEDKTFSSILEAIQGQGEKYLCRFKRPQDYHRAIRKLANYNIQARADTAFSSIPVRPRLLQNWLLWRVVWESRKAKYDFEIEAHESANKMLSLKTQRERIALLNEWFNNAKLAMESKFGRI